MVLRAQLSDTELGVQFGAEDEWSWYACFGELETLVGVVGLPERLLFKVHRFYLPASWPVGMKTDGIRTDITDIVFVFIFVFEYGVRYR